MKTILLCCLFISSIFANEYYAKLEPLESYQIKSSVLGKVIFSNEEIEGKNSNNSLIVEIDSKVNQIDLEQSRNKLNFLNEMILIETNNYNRLNKVSSKSEFEKDTQKLKIINLKSTKSDLIMKIENLKDTIKNKKLIEESNYIFNIAVKKGDYVNAGTLLYEAKDLSKAKVEIFVPILEIDDIKNKSIYIDGKKSDVKINKIYDIADSTHISAYKVELILENTKTFSRLVKIEFK
ncbi:HlyD family efflux transporter periplasmic adaptor subunit [Poseidonibacter sp.]|uniref:HlyD family efflux transporter periplasmic adaptor subunit n=1 Tax=Poseidonibacter sp. TaxID=2321188 RepID=UPI003C749E80